MTTMDDWTEVGGGGDQEMWDRSGVIIGRYIRKQDGVGRNKSRIYTLETDAGPIGVWGSTVLDTKFDSIPMQSMVRIEYNGMMQSKGGGSYHDYKVMFKQDAQQREAEDEAAEVVEEDDHPKAKASKDVVLDDLPAGENINIDDIPF